MLTLIGSGLVPGRAGEFKLGDRALKVPAGFTIEPVAGPPLNGGGLDHVQVAALLTASDPDLKETGSWIIGRHPEWAGALADFFRDRLIKGKLTVVDQAELERQLARFAAAPAIQSLAGRAHH